MSQYFDTFSETHFASEFPAARQLRQITATSCMRANRPSSRPRASAEPGTTCSGTGHEAPLVENVRWSLHRTSSVFPKDCKWYTLQKTECRHSSPAAEIARAAAVAKSSHTPARLSHLLPEQHDTDMPLHIRTEIAVCLGPAVSSGTGNIFRL